MTQFGFQRGAADRESVPRRDTVALTRFQQRQPRVASLAVAGTVATGSGATLSHGAGPGPLTVAGNLGWNAADFLSTGLFDAGAYNAPPAAGSIAAVPEPTGLAAGVIAAVMLAGRRIARRSSTD